MTPEAWQLQLALGACRAGRLLALACLVFALYGLHMLIGPVALPVPVLCVIAVLAVLPGLYLAMRLEIDRGLFQRLAERLDTIGDDLATLDCALAELGLKKETDIPRSLPDRVTGVFRLTKALGVVVAVQAVSLSLIAVSL